MNDKNKILKERDELNRELMWKSISEIRKKEKLHEESIISTIKSNKFNKISVIILIVLAFVTIIVTLIK